uniref:FCP1 homology domain-containing protein n=1 Tax=Alexandrium catenella TaxID=2925 RepID=A0A7S1WHG6_ALECA
MDQRAKRKALEAAAAVSAYKKLAAAGKPSAVVNPATGETAEQRAKRKGKEAAEAAQVAKRARQAGDRSSALRREKSSRSENGGTAPAFSLYDGLPEPDPEKDALAARLAEAANRENDSGKMKYTEDRTKIVFLDIDGVLRPLYGGQFQMSSITMDGENVPIVDGDTEFKPSAMHSLRQILEQTGAALVLSSEWRRHPTLREGVNANLRQKGLPMVIDDTPLMERDLTGNPLRSFAIRRAREIGLWLKSHPEVRQWVALDDIDLGEADEERQAGQPLITPRFVLTEKSACLLPTDAQMAVNILGGKLNPLRVFDEVPG